jgi:hypothetical protein
VTAPSSEHRSDDTPVPDGNSPAPAVDGFGEVVELQAKAGPQGGEVRAKGPARIVVPVALSVLGALALIALLMAGKSVALAGCTCAALQMLAAVWWVLLRRRTGASPGSGA